MREWARAVDGFTTFSMREETHRGAVLARPAPTHAGVFRVQGLDRREDAVDWKAHVVEPRGKAGEHVTGIRRADRLAHEPVPEAVDPLENVRFEGGKLLVQARQ